MEWVLLALGISIFVMIILIAFLRHTHSWEPWEVVDEDHYVSNVGPRIILEQRRKCKHCGYTQVKRTNK